jgi:Subtilase family
MSADSSGEQGPEEAGGKEARPRIAWSDGPNSYAFVQGRLLVRGEPAATYIDSIEGRDHPRRTLSGRDEAPDAAWTVVDDVADVVATAELGRADGVAVAPDHVFFAHDCDECCGAPHPSLTFDSLAADPYRANPYRANPYRANPYRANPYRANPYRANPYRANPQTSSALPASDRDFPPCELAGPGAHPRITVLDTGVADGAQLSPLLSAAGARVSGDSDEPDGILVTTSGTAWGRDGWLDPVAGHGTFIAGIIEQLAPGCSIRVVSVISGLGDGVESEIVTAILAEAALPEGDRPDILSMSFGGPGLAGAPALRSAVAKAQQSGIVVVASAGNEGTSDPQYPAAYDGVVGVGAVGPDGPTPWTNYGSWVNACAPGADLVSSFFADFDGPDPRVNTEDPDRFGGWARWSGTSFATPVVVAALAREMVLGSCNAHDAVQHVVYSPAALRIRCLGTVVTA